MIKYSLRQKTKKAFSLIEILVAVLLIGFLFSISSQKLFNRGQKVRAVFDRLIRLNNRLVTVSTLHNKTYRLVLQLDIEKQDQYWVEKKQVFRGGEGFQIDDSFYSEPQKLPALLDIVKVETKSANKEEGTVYVYYYPSALAQATKIYFLRPENQGAWILYLDPVTKKLQVLKEEK